jgi:hypothetical protein
LNGTFFGSSGTSGSSGAQGSTGSAGSSGTSGTSFYGVTSGSSGTSGASGTSGTTPPGFTNGTSGTSGLDGTYFGSSGSSGTAGSGGSSGTSFYGVTSGTSGTSVPGITSGSSGSSATSGSGGTSGFMNLTGNTNNGVLTYDSVLPGGQVESNLTFDGATLSLTGNLSVTGNTTNSGFTTSTTFRETYSNEGTGGSVTLDLSIANNFRRQFNGAATITFSNAPASNAFGFTLTTVNAGAYVITWPVSVDWVGGIAPVLTSSGTDVLTFFTFDGGTTYYGFVVGKNLS